MSKIVLPKAVDYISDLGTIYNINYKKNQISRDGKVYKIDSTNLDAVKKITNKVIIQKQENVKNIETRLSYKAQTKVRIEDGIMTVNPASEKLREKLNLELKDLNKQINLLESININDIIK